jgi:hypothetical protein
MDNNKLVKNLMKEKLAIMRHYPKDINILTKNNYNLVDSMSRYNFWSDWEGNTVNVIYDGLKSFNDYSIERIVEHECCHLADIKEDKIINYQMMHSNPLMNMSAKSLYEAFRDYVSLERQEKVFFKKNLFDFSTKGIEEYKDTLIETTKDSEKLDRLNILNKFIPEIFKAEFVNYEIEGTDVLKMILSPIEEIFYLCKETNFSATDKVNIMAPALCQYLVKFCPSETFFNNQITLCPKDKDYDIMQYVPKSHVFSIQYALTNHINNSFEAIQNKEPIDSLRPIADSLKIAMQSYKEMVGDN